MKDGIGERGERRGVRVEGGRMGVESVRACECACVRMCVRVCVRAKDRESTPACIRACVRACVRQITAALTGLVRIRIIQQQKMSMQCHESINGCD